MRVAPSRRRRLLQNTVRALRGAAGHPLEGIETFFAAAPERNGAQFFQQRSFNLHRRVHLPLFRAVPEA